MEPISFIRFCSPLEKVPLFRVQEKLNITVPRPGITFGKAKKILESRKFVKIDVLQQFKENHFLLPLAMAAMSFAINSGLVVSLISVSSPFSQQLPVCSHPADSDPRSGCHDHYGLTYDQAMGALSSISAIYFLIAFVGACYQSYSPVKKALKADNTNAKIDLLQASLTGYKQGLLPFKDAVRIFPLLAEKGNFLGLDQYNFTQLKACRQSHRELFDKLVGTKAFNAQQRPIWRLLQRLEEAKEEPKFIAEIINWKPNRETLAAEPAFFELFLKEFNSDAFKKVHKLCSKILHRKVLASEAAKVLDEKSCLAIVDRVATTAIGLKEAIAEALDPIDGLKVACSLGSLNLKIDREIANIIFQNIEQVDARHLGALRLADLNSLIAFLTSGEVSFLEQYAVLKTCKALMLYELAQELENSLVEEVAFLSQHMDLLEVADECVHWQLQLLGLAIDTHLSQEMAQTSASCEKLIAHYYLPVSRHLLSYQSTLKEKIVQKINTLSRVKDALTFCSELIHILSLMEKADSESEFVELIGKEVKKWMNLYPQNIETLWREANKKHFPWLLQLIKRAVSKNPSLLCSWHNPDNELIELKSVIEI